MVIGLKLMILYGLKYLDLDKSCNLKRKNKLTKLNLLPNGIFLANKGIYKGNS